MPLFGRQGFRDCSRGYGPGRKTKASNPSNCDAENTSFDAASDTSFTSIDPAVGVICFSSPECEDDVEIFENDDVKLKVPMVSISVEEYEHLKWENKKFRMELTQMREINRELARNIQDLEKKLLTLAFV